MSGIIGPTCKTPGEAMAAATSIAASKAAPKGMKAKVTVTGVNPVGDLFAASVAIEYVPDPNAEPSAAEAANTDDGKTDGEGEGESSKSSEAKDSHSLNAVQEKGLDSSLTDPTIIAAMEQLPDANQNLLVAEVQDNGPQSAEAIAMAEEMKTEFNDQPDDLMVIGNSSTTPEQHASNEAHNQRELDAEETRREQAIANAAQSQKEALSPDPLT